MLKIVAYIVLAVVVTWLFRFQISSSQEGLYKLDRWTGKVWRYNASDILGHRWLQLNN